jgi:hypothetical protein
MMAVKARPLALTVAAIGIGFGDIGPAPVRPAIAGTRDALSPIVAVSASLHDQVELVSAETTSASEHAIEDLERYGIE